MGKTTGERLAMKVLIENQLPIMFKMISNQVWKDHNSRLYIPENQSEIDMLNRNLERKILIRERVTVCGLCAVEHGLIVQLQFENVPEGSGMCESCQAEFNKLKGLIL